ncbi:MAG: Ig-like domain-containing protein [Oscillospiraceae bacterium]|nr:Ig-like domain-containing protein [Oscillospiraceae bacterium]
MLRPKLQRLLGTAAALVIGITGLPAMPAAAEDPQVPELRISSYSVSAETLMEDPIVSVDLSIAGSDAGVAADSFGIVYDSALVFNSITPIGTVGAQHTAVPNPDENIIWLTGAEFTGAAKSEVLYRLEFQLEGAQEGERFPVEFLWTGLDDSAGFFYSSDCTDITQAVKAAAVDGGIIVPDPNAIALDYTELQLNPGQQQTLQVLNASSDTATWFSSNPEIVSVDSGVLTAVSPGAATVRVFVDNKLLQCNVTVTSEYYYTMGAVDTVHITSRDQVVILKFPGNPKSVSWFSSNLNIVTVEGGVLSGVDSGIASVFADGGDAAYMVTVIVEYADDILYGDANGDGQVDIIDVICINKDQLGSYRIPDSRRRAADAWMDGSITFMDAVCVMKHLVDLIPELPYDPNT